MARWTEADHTAVRAAYLSAMVDGISKAVIGGQETVSRTAAEWELILDRIEKDLLDDADSSLAATGLRVFKINPLYA